jgi:hypothetical protein
MSDAVHEEHSENTEKQEKPRKGGWLWPVGVAATSVAGAALLMLRGCWHRRMSWPIRMQEHSYRVCLDCGVKQLFDEKQFRSYGPFRYGLNELIAWEKREQAKSRAPERAAS